MEQMEVIATKLDCLKYSVMTYLGTSSSLLFQNFMISNGMMVIKTCSAWWCLVVIEYMVFSARPHYSALVMSCILPAPEERCAPHTHDKLITSHVFFRKNRPAPPPQLGFTKGHLVGVQDLLENYSNDCNEQGQCFLGQSA